MTADEARALLLVYTPEEVWRDHAPSYLLHLWSRCGTPRLTADQVLRAAVNGTRGFGYRRMAHLAVREAWEALKVSPAHPYQSFDHFVVTGCSLLQGVDPGPLGKLVPILRQQSLTYGDLKDVLKSIERLYAYDRHALSTYFNRVLDAWLTEPLPGKTP